MRTVHRLSALVAVALALAPLAARADVKLGFVDMKRALNEVDEGKAAKEQLKKDFEAKQQTLDQKQEELKRLKAEFDKQAVVMSDATKREKQAQFDQKMMETQQLYMQLQKELSQREQQLTGKIFEKMAGIIRGIAEAEGFTMIFDRDQSGLVYAPVSLDVTNELIRKYNTMYGASGAKRTAAAPAKGGKK